MIDSSIMRKVDGLDDGFVRHHYLTMNSDEARIGMAQIWSYKGTSKKNSDSMIQRLADELTAKAKRTAIWCFNGLQMSRRLELKKQQLVDAIAWAEDDDDKDDKVAERLRWNWDLGK